MQEFLVKDESVLVRDLKLNLYLIKINDTFMIINTKKSNVPSKDYRYWKFINNIKFSDNFQNNKNYALEGEAIEFKLNKGMDDSEASTIFFIIKSLMESKKSRSIGESLNVIENYFKQISDFTKIEIQGLFAEFMFIKYMKQNNVDMEFFYHDNMNSMFDFYVNGKYLEIKSSLNYNFRYMMSYNQSNHDYKNLLLVTLNLFEDENGITLLELINSIDIKKCNYSYSLDKLKFNLTQDINANKIKFSVDKYIIRFYDNVSIPKINVIKSDKINLSKLHYQVIMDDVKTIKINDFCNKLKLN